jgi:hypothetical protein
MLTPTRTKRPGGLVAQLFAIIKRLIMMRPAAAEKMTGKRVLTDPEAASADPKTPAFIARPEGAPVYHGFPIVPESETDGWFLGVISDPADPNGCDWGDAFVVAPDRSRAGLVWAVGEGDIYEIMPPSPGRWVVDGLWFPKPIRTTDELVQKFRAVLPELKAFHQRVLRT